MTPEEVSQLQTVSLRKQGKSCPYAHPDTYIQAGSLLTIQGIDWAVPPLYPSKATAVVPSFADDPAEAVVVKVDVDETVVDEVLVDLANRIREKVTVHHLEPCPTCGRAQAAELAIDPITENVLVAMMLQYARLCLDKLYDLTPENLTTLLSFSSDILPDWMPQILDHTAGTEAG